MKKHILTLAGKGISITSKLLKRGNGSTWPGHIALTFEKNYIRTLLKNSPTQVVLVAGTNGKTTTATMLTTILKEQGFSVIQNTSGANLLNGIASSLMLNTNAVGRLTADFAIFEVDENNLSLILQQVSPLAIIVLDLFRDQLDRYGELDSIAGKWKEAFSQLTSETKLILNADDPLVAFLGHDVKTPIVYFGLTEKGTKTLSHAADSLYCPRCNNRLSFSSVSYSHIGIWRCESCNLERPTPQITTSFYPLEGTYNKYNTLAAIGAAQALGIPNGAIQKALHAVTAAFGRQEILEIDGKKVQLFLSKNPTGFNESLKTIAEKKAKHVLFVLNDRIPDGRDISWIWDMDIEPFINDFESVAVSGDRVYDMALRLQYASDNKKTLSVYEKLEDGVKYSLEKMGKNETLYILPTYSAMLEVRKILTGRKIL
ncbi:MAG TPA: Mur ligase family protein [Patescibacteria group bacterium]|nr:Mur ligase family protein [Patescibacteria group bacterium]